MEPTITIVLRDPALALPSLVGEVLSKVTMTCYNAPVCWYLNMNYSASGSIIERPNIQPIRLPEEVVAIMEEKLDLTEKHRENDKVNVEEDTRGLDKVK